MKHVIGLSRVSTERGRPARLVRALASTGATSILLIGLGLSSAVADESPHDDAVQGIQPLPKGYATLADTPEYKAQAAVAEARYKVFELWSQKAELMQARASAKDVGAVDRRIADAQARVEKLDGAPMLPAGASSSSVAAVDGPEKYSGPPPGRSLKLTHSAQSNGYFCGPATTAMVIRMSGGGEVSKYDKKHKMSQTTLANATYLATTKDGTNINRIPVALKRWMKLSTSVYWAPSATKLKNLVTGAIGGQGHGVAYGTREVKDKAHYNGHPKNKPLDHFIAGYGYTGQGANLLYADPATSRFPAAKKTNYMSAPEMRDFIAVWGVVA